MWRNPPGGPQLDDENNEVHANYVWDGESVTEGDFYLSLIDRMDAENMIQVDAEE